MALSNILEVVERSLYKKLEGILIAEAYMPDKSLYPNTIQGINDYNAAVQAIIISKGFSIALFGVGSSQKKYLKTIPRIVIVERKFIPGDLGGSPDPEAVLDIPTQTFSLEVTPPQTSNYHFQVNMAFSSAKQERAMEAIVALAFNNRAYVKYYTDPTSVFFVIRYNSTVFEDNDRGIKEKIYLYEAKDIWESNPTIVQTDVKPIVEIRLDIEEENNRIDSTIITP